jgi:hypothetical protein
MDIDGAHTFTGCHGHHSLFPPYFFQPRLKHLNLIDPCAGSAPGLFDYDL